MTSERNAAYSQFQGMKIEIMISCTGLVDLDTFTKSDPMCVLFVKRMGQWIEHDRTEAIINTLEPKFVKSFILDYDPRKYHNLRFSVYDIDYRDLDLDRQDFVGYIDVNFMELVDTDDVMHTFNRPLRVLEHSRHRGIITITTELVHDARNKVSIHVAGHNLHKKGFLTMKKPNIFLQIGRELQEGVFHPVYRTETYPESTDPRWRPFNIDCQKLCNNDLDRNIRLSCWYYSRGDSRYHMIGQMVCKPSELSNSQPSKSHYQSFDLLSRKKENEKQKVRGQLRLISFRIEMKYTLMDFLIGGLHLNLAIAIDFTASNGSLDDEHSLHNIQDLSENHYIDAIESIGGMITDLNMDKKVAAYGFGAKWMKKEHPSHCFPLNGDKHNNYLQSIQDVIDTYQKVLPALKFSGPTKLSSVIEKVTALAESQNMSKDKHIYTVLLIITDGVINDMNKTLKRLVDGSHYPLSVIFVGVGPADFTLMEQFNTDQNPLRYEQSRKLSERPNTYFIPYKKEEVENYGDKVLKSNTMDVLSRQILQYMRMKRFEPRSPVLRRNGALSSSNLLGCIDTERASSMDHHTQSKSSIKTTAPACPTCGAPIDRNPPRDLIKDVSLINVATL